MRGEEKLLRVGHAAGSANESLVAVNYLIGVLLPICDAGLD